ncbi:MAG: putative quinol monooxygenase [Acidimicrobiales bacterium]
MTTVALVVKLTAKAGAGDEVAGFLAGAVELANAEAGTPVWFALRSDESTFWIFDAFPGEAERQAHLDGPIAAALMANADRLLSAPPEINRADVLASKVPAA